MLRMVWYSAQGVLEAIILDSDVNHAEIAAMLTGENSLV